MGTLGSEEGDIMLSGLARACVALAMLSGAAAGLIGGPAPARAAAEFMVNSFTGGGQSSPAIALLANGRFVVVWRNDGVSTPDPNDREGRVSGQLYAANGTKVGEEFLVNKKAFGNAYVNLGLAAVAVLTDGTFVVVWSSDADDDAGWGNIQGRRFSALGEPISNEFRVKRRADASLDFSSVAALADGGFVVCWPGEEIYCQRHAANSQKVSQFRVNKSNGFQDDSPAVAGLPDIAATSRAAAPGGFVVVWREDEQNGTRAVYGQLYAADGSKVGGRFTVGKALADIRNPRVAVLQDGSFVVVWEWFTDAFVYNVRVQRYSAEGVKLNGFWVNKTRRYSQATPDVAGLSDGGFIVVYTDNEAQDGRIIAHRYADDGTPVGESFRVNSSKFQSYRLHPAAAGLTNGKFAVAWTGQEEGDPLVEDFDVFGRVFKD